MPMLILLVSQKRFKLQSLIDFGGRYNYRDSYERTDYNRICSNHMDRTMKRFIIQMGIMCSAYCAALIGPAYGFIKHGVRSTFIEARIPFSEPKSDAEFAGNFLSQIINGSYGIIAYIRLECFLSLLGKFTLIVQLQH